MNSKNIFIQTVCLTMTLAALSVSACKPAHGDETDRHSEAFIRQRIDTIYATVGKTTVDEKGKAVDYIQNTFNRDSAYCSERYYALMQETARLCDETGDILYDYDHWVCGQDFADDWDCQVERVYNITDSTALADLNIHNFSDSKTTIALRYERGNWYIDDFSPSEDGYDDKANLREMIRTLNSGQQQLNQ